MRELDEALAKHLDHVVGKHLERTLDFNEFRLPKAGVMYRLLLNKPTPEQPLYMGGVLINSLHYLHSC